MAFVEFFQFLGFHAPALGAFLLTLLVVVGFLWLSYHLGKREANRRWTFDVEHMPNVIGQDIRERYQRKIAELSKAVEMYKEREQRLGPAVAGATELLARVSPSIGAKP